MKIYTYNNIYTQYEDIYIYNNIYTQSTVYRFDYPV